ncbi:MAG: restriction endonuclease, partial [Proteobacteria bacterium]|nr:restriction endonuclease [Pseudomonadota bacterium]
MDTMSDPHRARRGHEMQAYRSSGAKGWGVALLGGLLLLASYQLPVGSSLQTLSVGLRPVAWLALLLGLAFVVYVRATRSTVPPPRVAEPAEDEAQAGMTRPSVLAALGVSRSSGAELEPRFVDTISVRPAAGEEDESEVEEEPETHWGPRLLAQLDWRRFEALCAAFFKQAGFAASTQSKGDDGGVDIWVQSRHMPEPRIVRCRHWEDQAVSAKELRDFLSAMSAQGLAHGTYVTSSTFSLEAMEF